MQDPVLGYRVGCCVEIAPIAEDLRPGRDKLPVRAHVDLSYFKLALLRPAPFIPSVYIVPSRFGVNVVPVGRAFRIILL